MAEIAAGLGDEYSPTGARPGALPRNKKGDGVLAVAGGAVNLVVEVTDSKRTSWNDYLQEAERNRVALASLGWSGALSSSVVNPSRPSAPGGSSWPSTRTPTTRRCSGRSCRLLRLAAVAANARQDTAEIETAREKLTEAIDLLGRIDEIKRLSGLVSGNATKIDKEAEGLRAGTGPVARPGHGRAGGCIRGGGGRGLIPVVDRVREPQRGRLTDAPRDRILSYSVFLDAFGPPA